MCAGDHSRRPGRNADKWVDRPLKPNSLLLVWDIWIDDPRGEEPAVCAELSTGGRSSQTYKGGSLSGPIDRRFGSVADSCRRRLGEPMAAGRDVEAGREFEALATT